MSGLIIGAGIGGLATAIALHRRGIQVRVFEAANSLSPLGAGIIVPPNAMNILARYGLAEKVRDAGRQLDSFVILDRWGKSISSVSARYAVRGFSYQAVAIHRGALQQILLRALAVDAVSTGKSCVRISQHAQRVDVPFVDGTTASGEFVIGADGIRSAVRQSLFPHSGLRYSGQTCWRGVAALTLPSAWANQFTEIWGRCGVFGFVQINASQVYWYVTQRASLGGMDDMQQVKQQLGRLHAASIKPVAELIAQTDATQIIRNDLFDLAPLTSWMLGRAVLIGDAAHAMLPNLGQGGAQAIEDAWTLSQMLAAHPDPATAFAHFQAARDDRVRKLAKISRSLAQVSSLCNAPLSRLRNGLFRAIPAGLSARQFRDVYDLPY